MNVQEISNAILLGMIELDGSPVNGTSFHDSDDFIYNSSFNYNYRSRSKVYGMSGTIRKE